MNTPRPWEIWWVGFDPQVGREQAGRRPAIVVNTPFACQLPNGLVVVVPVTTKDRRWPWHVPVMIGERQSYAMVDQVKSISTGRLLNRSSATISYAEIDAVKFTLKRIIDVS